MTPDLSPDPAGRDGRFHTTRWSLILSSIDKEGGEDKARAALSHLCRIYWRPIFAFICRSGRSPEDAQDLTQEFFLMVTKGSLLERADPERGRFRSLLLKSLQNFLIDGHTKSRALKRGGDVEFVSWDDWMAEAPSRLSVSATALESWSPEKVFDVRWAATVAEQALHRLQEECESRGRRRVFDALGRSLTAERGEVSYEAHARELGVKAEDVKRLLHQMRRRYREVLREAVAETVERPDEVDDELRYLCAALAAGSEA